MNAASQTYIFQKFKYFVKNLSAKQLALLVVVFVIAFAPIKISCERLLDHKFANVDKEQNVIDWSLREQIGQNSFLAVLGGFRSLIATVLSVQAISYWEETQWEKLDSSYLSITRLQPKIIFYWRDAKRFIGDDAVSHYDNVSQEKLAVRRYWRNVYAQKALDYLERGIKANGDGYELHFEKAMLYDIRYKDSLNAAKSFETAAKDPKAPGYIARRAAYEYAKSPGYEELAYQKFKKLYQEGEKNHMPTLLSEGYWLEKALAIPAEERIFSYDFLDDSYKLTIPKPIISVENLFRKYNLEQN